MTKIFFFFAFQTLLEKSNKLLCKKRCITPCFMSTLWPYLLVNQSANLRNKRNIQVFTWIDQGNNEGYQRGLEGIRKFPKGIGIDDMKT